MAITSIITPPSRGAVSKVGCSLNARIKLWVENCTASFERGARCAPSSSQAGLSASTLAPASATYSLLCYKTVIRRSNVNMAKEDVSVVRVELTEGLDSTNSTLIASSSIVNEPPLPQTAATDGGDIVMVDSDLTAKSSAQAAAAPNHPHPPWLIDPRKSKFIGYWDLVTGLALLFTAIVTPWEVAFAKPPTTALESMFLFNRFIDSIFVFDMGIQFCLIYQARIILMCGHAMV